MKKENSNNNINKTIEKQKKRKTEIKQSYKLGLIQIFLYSLEIS